MVEHNANNQDDNPLARITPKQCVFCGSDNVSREHFLPQWTRKYARPLDESRLWRLSVPIDSIRADADMPGRILQGDPFTYRPRVVCEECNTGWLSRFDEKEVKPVLQRFLTGTRHRLGPEPSAVVARWAAIRTMIGEFIDNATRVSTPAMRQGLRTGLPSGYQVWIGRSDLRRGSMIIQHGLSVTPSTPEWRAKTEEEKFRAAGAQLSLLQLGHLALMVYTRRTLVPPAPGDLVPDIFVPIPCIGRLDTKPLYSVNTPRDARRLFEAIATSGSLSATPVNFVWDKGIRPS